MTAFVLPTCFSGADATTSATVLAGYEASYMDMFLGNIPGCIGEVCKAAILLGFLYMLIRGVITWRIPVTFLAVVFVFSAILGNDPLQAILCAACAACRADCAPGEGAGRGRKLCCCFRGCRHNV